MGKGDKRTLKGKTFSGSYGNVRPHKAAAKPAVMPKATPTARKAPAKKAAAKKAWVDIDSQRKAPISGLFRF